MQLMSRLGFVCSSVVGKKLNFGLQSPYIAGLVNMPSSCSAFGCRNRLDGTNYVRFFRFPHQSESDRREKWIRAVNGNKQDGSPWEPSVHCRICSDHFIYGKPFNNPNHPDYVPSIFSNTRKHQQKVQNAVPRNQCLGSRSSVGDVDFTIKSIKLEPVTLASGIVQNVTNDDSITMADERRYSGQQQLQNAALDLGGNGAICKIMRGKRKNAVETTWAMLKPLCHMEWEEPNFHERLNMLGQQFKSHFPVLDHGENIPVCCSTGVENSHASSKNTANTGIPTEETLTHSKNDILKLKKRLTVLEREVMAHRYIQTLAKRKNVKLGGIGDCTPKEGKNSENQVLKSTSQSEKHNLHEDLSRNLALIECDAKSGCRRALFLLEQYENYNRKRSNWSDDMWILFATWQSRYFKAYNHVRDATILVMPAPGNSHLMQIKKQQRLLLHNWVVRWRSKSKVTG